MSRVLDRLRAWLRRRRHFRCGRMAVAELFDHPDRLASTSLCAAHRTRLDVVDVEVEADEVVAVLFAVLRHPRPYAFSRQFHEVAQLYRYDLPSQTIQHVRSLNLSRLRKSDGAPPGGYP